MYDPCRVIRHCECSQRRLLTTANANLEQLSDDFPADLDRLFVRSVAQIASAGWYVRIRSMGLDGTLTRVLLVLENPGPSLSIRFSGSLACRLRCTRYDSEAIGSTRWMG